MATGEPGRGDSAGSFADRISRALGRPWSLGEAPPTFERLTTYGFCERCDARNRERRRRQRASREQVPGCRIVRRPVPLYQELAYEVGLALRNARREVGLSQAAVARRLGRRQTFLSKLEAGERRLTLLDVVEVLAVMGVDPAQFAQLVGSIWRKRVYRYLKPIFEVGAEDQESS